MRNKEVFQSAIKSGNDNDDDKGYDNSLFRNISYIYKKLLH